MMLTSATFTQDSHVYRDVCVCVCVGENCIVVSVLHTYILTWTGHKVVN